MRIPQSATHTQNAPVSRRYLSSSTTRWQGAETDSKSAAEGASTPPPSQASEKPAENAKADKAKEEKVEKTEVEKLKEEKDDLMVCSSSSVQLSMLMIIDYFLLLALPSTLPSQSRLRYLQADLMNAQRIAGVEKEKMRDFAIVKFAGE